MLATLVSAMFLDRTWGTPTLMCEIGSKQLSESSGIAASRITEGVYLTHNDSGDKPRFFKFSKNGIQATYELKGASALDWEDMASTRIKGRNWLYFGDIGDNALNRKNISIYRLEEPRGEERVLSKFDTYSLTYPDGTHNCESLFADPNSGDVYLVTKSEGASTVFKLKAPSRSGTYVLEKLGSVRPDTGMGKYGRMVTAGDVDPAGKHVILRTYSGALEYHVKGKFQDWWKSTPRAVNLPFMGQSEAICYTSNGQELVTTCEGNPCPVHIIALQK